MSLLHTMLSLHLPPLPHILSILHGRMKRVICIVCVKHVSWAFLNVFYGCFSHAIEVMRTLHPSGRCARVCVRMSVTPASITCKTRAPGLYLQHFPVTLTIRYISVDRHFCGWLPLVALVQIRTGARQ